MHLNIRGLQALRALLAEGTVSAAARRLHRSQPAVSRMLAQLEGDVGFQLFLREGRRITLTPQALAFCRETERAFTALAQIEAAAGDIRARQEAPLMILAQWHIVHGLLPAVLAKFCARHPAFRFSVEVRSREYISHWIANRQFDVGFAPPPVDHPQVDVEPLVSGPMLVFVPAGHRLARLPRIRIADLDGEPLVTTHTGAPLRTRLEGLFAAAGLRPLIRAEVPSAHTACQLVAGGIGCTIADPFLSALFREDPRVRVRPLAPREEIEYLVLRPRGVPTPPLADEFIAAVRAHAARLVKAKPGSDRPKKRQKGV